VQFDEGDAEELPYAARSFDLVVSLIGAMFAPRPDRVAAELVRVCRPGGQIVMGNWTAAGFVGQLFKCMARHVPPSPLMPSPLLWGDESTVRLRFGTGVSSLSISRQLYPFDYAMPPAAVVDHFRLYYGPTKRAFAALEGPAQQRLHADLVDLWSSHNEAADGSTRYRAEYLHVVAVCG
jgi:SAM-dependent methyltransferase